MLCRWETQLGTVGDTVGDVTEKPSSSVLVTHMGIHTLDF